MIVKNLKNVKSKKMCVYVTPCNSMLTYLAVMCIYVIYKCSSWGSDQQQDLSKPRQKTAKLSDRWEAVKHPIPCGGEKIRSALRKEQGWTHLLWFCQRLAIQVCMSKNVN